MRQVNRKLLLLAMAFFQGCGSGDLAHTTVPGGTGRPPLPVPASLSSLFLQPATKIRVGQRPLSLAVGDLNGDSRLDLVSANNGSNDVSFAFGRGDGTFQESVAMPAGDSPFGVATGDLNGDGLADIVSTNYGGPLLRGSLAICLSLPGGRFLPARRVEVGDGPTAVIVVDLNRDGVLDLACTNFRENTVSILQGSGDGSFAAPVFYPVGVRARALAAGDLNRDGLLDLAIANEGQIGAGDVSILLGQSGGSFASATFLTAGGNPHGVELADLNQDGWLDLVVANFTSNDLSLLLGSGGGFLPAVTYPQSPTPLSVSLTDLNQDGRVDIAAAIGSNGSVSLLEGLGSGDFVSAGERPSGAATFFVSSGDFDGDGKPDLALANAGSNDLSVLLNEIGK